MASNPSLPPRGPARGEAATLGSQPNDGAPIANQKARYPAAAKPPYYPT